MRLYLDNDIDPCQAPKLRAEGHNVFCVREYPEHKAKPDVFHAKQAERENRVLVSKDRDYGELREKGLIPVSGIVYVRGKAALQPDYDERLVKVFVDHKADLERGALVTIGPQHVRIRELQQEKTQAEAGPILAAAERDARLAHMQREQPNLVHELRPQKAKDGPADGEDLVDYARRKAMESGTNLHDLGKTDRTKDQNQDRNLDREP